MTPSQTLIAAKPRIINPENWTKDYFAKDHKGWQVRGDSAYATCFCSLGAIQAVTEPNTWDIVSIGPQSVIDYLVRAIDAEFKALTDEDDIDKGYKTRTRGYGYVSRYNDRHTHEEVMAMYDRAIEMALGEGQ